MARDTAARRQHALRCMEAVNVIGAGFDPHQQHLKNRWDLWMIYGSSSPKMYGNIIY
jgi:hypothetical protein